MRPDPLSDAAARRHELTRSRAVQALRELGRSGVPVTFARVAQAAGFSELPDISAAQTGYASSQPITKISGISESPGRCGVVADLIPTETGHTGLNQAAAFSSLPIFDVSRSGP